MLTNSLSSNLNFSFLDVKNFTESNPPNVIYRYFRNTSDRDSFLNGDVRFSGPSTNRFFLNDSQDPFDDRRSQDNDKYEYRTDHSSFLGQYSLSFSKEIIKPYRPNIKITDISGFIKEVIIAIKNTTLNHRVSWHPINQLIKHRNIVPAISCIKKYPIQDDETMTLYLLGVRGAESIYVDKSIPSFDLADPFGPVRNAYNQSKVHEREKEYRVSLSTHDFLGDYSCLSHLVKYLHLTCPNISKYCIPI